MAAECSPKLMTINKYDTKGRDRSPKVTKSAAFTPKQPPGITFRRASVNGRAEATAKYQTTGILELRCCHCQRKQSQTSKWTKIRMLRTIALCSFLLLLATCAGLVLNKTLDYDVISSHTNNTLDIDYHYEAVDVHVDSDILMDFQLESVPLKELKQSIRKANDSYDIIRIFLRQKDVSDDQIHELLAAKTLENLLSGKSEKKREYDYEEEDFFELENFAETSADHIAEEIEEAFNHMDEVESSPLGNCKYPQPEIVNVIADELYPNAILMPECTILHRCRNTSGCCGNTSQECGPKYINVVYKKFLVLLVTDLEDSYVRPHKELVHMLPFINHTECGCKEKKGLPGCDKDCPFPFSKARPDLKCICQCFEAENEKNIKCRKVQDGLQPLAEKQLECIKKGNCIMPECSRSDKEFDVRTGLCPIISEDEQGLKGYITKSKNHKSQKANKHKHNRHHNKNGKRKNRGN